MVRNLKGSFVRSKSIEDMLVLKEEDLWTLCQGRTGQKVLMEINQSGRYRRDYHAARQFLSDVILRPFACGHTEVDGGGLMLVGERTHRVEDAAGGPLQGQTQAKEIAIQGRRSNPDAQTTVLEGKIRKPSRGCVASRPGAEQRGVGRGATGPRTASAEENDTARSLNSQPI
jgi:hypothetical protein